MDKLFVCVIKDGEQIKEVYIVGSLIPGSPVEVERCMGGKQDSETKFGDGRKVCISRHFAFTILIIK